jgi:hypothetical protein
MYSFFSYSVSAWRAHLSIAMAHAPFVARESAEVIKALDDAKKIILAAQAARHEAGKPNMNGDALVEALKALYNAIKWAASSAAHPGGYWNHVVDPRVVGPPGVGPQLNGVVMLRADGTYELMGSSVPDATTEYGAALLTHH